jgi:predicted RNA methylase
MRKLLALTATALVLLGVGSLATRRPGNTDGNGTGDGVSPPHVGSAGPADSTTTGALPPSRIERLGLPRETSVGVQAWRRVEDFPCAIAQFQTVFWEPRDTESLRELIRESASLKGRSVLEIGTGTGLLSLCCLKAGAARVVATDVNPSAIANLVYNAEILGIADRLETRLVPLDRAGAFAVIGDGERFDLILSNPPWEDGSPGRIDDYALYDRNFALLHSLLKGLDAHLTPGGRALLAYGCVDAIETLEREAGRRHGLAVRRLDPRKLEDLPAVFLPGMLLEVLPAPSESEGRPNRGD